MQGKTHDFCKQGNPWGTKNPGKRIRTFHAMKKTEVVPIVFELKTLFNPTRPCQKRLNKRLKDANNVEKADSSSPE